MLDEVKRFFGCIKKLALLAFLPSSFILLTSCAQQQVAQYDMVTVVEQVVVDETSVPIFPRKAALTTDTARRFAIDLPKRCNVDWNNQRVLSILPSAPVEFVRVDRGDDLPGFMVSDFSFEKATLHEVMTRLLDGTDITVSVPENVPDKISGEITSATLDDALDLIANMAHAYYSYDDDNHEITIRRNAKWIMKMPRDENMIMALVDAMRGANMRNLIVNWHDKTLLFEGNYQTEREAKQIVNAIAEKKHIVAWDIDVYRVYPKTDNPIVWMDILPALGESNVKMSVPGVVGRLLVTGPEINTRTLQSFLAAQSNVVLISQGSFAIPSGWQGRFDIGQCSREERLETDLILGAQGKFGNFGGINKIDSEIVLSTTAGQLSKFSVPSSLGDNFVIIGIPTHAFVTEPETLISPFAELVVFVSPRLIEITESESGARMSGDDLRKYLDE